MASMWILWYLVTTYRPYSRMSCNRLALSRGETPKGTRKSWSEYKQHTLDCIRVSRQTLMEIKITENIKAKEK